MLREGSAINTNDTTAARQAANAIRPQGSPAGRGVAAILSDSTDRQVVSPNACGKRIGVLIVSYNAVTTIGKVLKRIPADVWDNVEEVVILDDASRDHTYELALGLKMLSGLEKLTVIKNDSNLGYGGNQKLGYKYFIEKGFDIVVLLHGDGQYAPEILYHLYAPLVAGEAEAVFGSRMMSAYGGPIRGGMPVYKYLGNKILTYFENNALGMDLTEFHSGYRAYSLSALRKIDFDDMTDVFHFDTQIIIKLHHQGFRITEVPIPTYYGDEICHVNGLRYARDVFLAVVRYKRTAKSLACYPEFKEYFVHYPIKESKHSSHHYFLTWAGREQDILDIGCGEGFFAERLVAQGSRVTGIDILPQPRRRAALGKYIQADLDQGLGQAIPELGDSRFDRVLLQDVLEHVRNPAKLLTDCHQLLRPQGLLLVSVPNVANITVRLALLFGRFEYAERGILDKTHVRFFTRKSARRLLESAGYRIAAEKVTVMPVELVFGLPADNPLMLAINAVLAMCTKLLPCLLGYQLLFSVRSPLGSNDAETDEVRRG
ncbi:MAG: bifunctional glycosyltransferase/class I SAM-dependent methyltransferase [Sterolibacterium sp.]|jgi:2-polyprenyl-3-methyl-5-hydroxy-6-metoxy-1,4-benzoquinol methylase